MDKLALRSNEKAALQRKLENVNINDITKALLGIVVDRPEGTIFYEYEPKENIGRNIYAELLDKYRPGKGFILSDDMEEIGLLSQTQGACSLATLIDKYSVFSALPEEDARQLKDIYEDTVRDVLARIRSEEGFVFDATPYNVAAFDAEYAYIDSMTWTVSAFLGALSLNGRACPYMDAGEETIGVSFSREETSAMLAAIAFSIGYLRDSFIDNEKARGKRLARGWNFTGKCLEPSLYFTYAVSECYLDIYNAFRQVIDRHNIGLKIEKIKNSERYGPSRQENFMMYLSADNRLAYEEIDESSDSFREQEQLFELINGGDDRFYELEKQVKAAAHDAWDLVKDGIDENFYNYNLSVVIDPQTVESSSSSDALFNGIFVINNVISGGLDEELNDQLAEAEDENEMNRIQGEYDDLLETLQAALLKTIRYNKAMRARQKDYIVNDFIISCTENFDGAVARKAQELRKRRIKAFTISPLLVNTNNLISEFLTKYPQIDMIKYLDELLMKKRSTVEDYDENGKEDPVFIWIWENGEYLVTSNYYYLTSLASFYEYVENYEQRFSAIDHSNMDFRRQVIAEHMDMERSGGEIFRLNRKTRELEEDRQRLEAEKQQLQERICELEGRESEVENALHGFLQQELKENLITWITEGLKDVNDSILKALDVDESERTALTDESIERDHPREAAFLAALRDTAAVSSYRQLRDRLDYLGGVEGGPRSVVEKMKENYDKNAKKTISDIINSEDFRNSNK